MWNGDEGKKSVQQKCNTTKPGSRRNFYWDNHMGPVAASSMKPRVTSEGVYSPKSTIYGNRSLVLHTLGPRHEAEFFR